MTWLLEVGPALTLMFAGAESLTSLTETEPPAYSDLYSRENSQLDRLVVSAVISPTNQDQLQSWCSDL